MSHVVNNRIQDDMAEEYSFLNEIQKMYKENHSALDIIKQNKKRLERRFYKWFKK